MIKINCKDGKTMSFNLEKEDEAKLWNQVINDGNFDKNITGIGILYNTHWHTIPMPKKFKKVSFRAELVKSMKKGIIKVVGERIICHAGDIQVSLIVYHGNRPKMARVDIKWIGRQIFIPA